MDTAGISQDEFRDAANAFRPEELGSTVDVNGMMRSDMLQCWYEVDKRGVGMSSLLEKSLGAWGAPCMCCHGATHDGANLQQRGHGLLRDSWPEEQGSPCRAAWMNFVLGLLKGWARPGKGVCSSM